MVVVLRGSKDVVASVDTSTGIVTAPAAKSHAASRKKVRKHKGKAKITKTKKRRFLEALIEMPNISRACRLINVSRTAMYAHKHKSPKFAAAWEEAYDMGVEGLEEHAWERAREKGKPSDILTMFLLKANRPEKYRDNVDITTGGKPIDARITHVLVNIPVAPELASGGHEALPEGDAENIVDAQYTVETAEETVDAEVV